MTRTALLLAPCLLVAACDRSSTEPRIETNAATSFDNTAATASIIQPEVAAESPPEPTPMPSSTPAERRSLVVFFARGAALDDAARAALDGFLPEMPEDARLVLRGHSDSPGGDAANLAQSRRRAEAVRAYFLDNGVDAARIAVIALGERRPVAPNAHRDGSDDPAGRARNRRVEIEVLPPAPSADPLPADGATPQRIGARVSTPASASVSPGGGGAPRSR